MEQLNVGTILRETHRCNFGISKDNNTSCGHNHICHHTFRVSFPIFCRNNFCKFLCRNKDLGNSFCKFSCRNNNLDSELCRRELCRRELCRSELCRSSKDLLLPHRCKRKKLGVFGLAWISGDECDT